MEINLWFIPFAFIFLSAFFRRENINTKGPLLKLLASTMASSSWHCLALELCFSIVGFVLCGVCCARFYPASFVFGDSLVDAGNNNFLLSLSKANYVPNGIDFGRPTGRYTNGRTIPDIVGQ